VPSSTPEEFIRAVWDELQRIGLSFSDIDRPLSMSAHGADTIQVGATATYSTMLNASPTVDWQQPGDTFNPGTGVWTCPQEGLYLINATIVSNPFAAPATKSYQVSLRLTKAGSAAGVYTFGGGGVDDQFVTAAATLLLPMQQGDTLVMTGAGIHATKTGPNNVTAYLNVIRQSGVGNAD
jgi:hypothetical protein